MTARTPAAGISVDDVRGHIAVLSGAGPTQVTFVDLGPVLALWSHEGADLTPDVAESLGQALIDWAARKRNRTSPTPALIGRTTQP